MHDKEVVAAHIAQHKSEYPDEHMPPHLKSLKHHGMSASESHEHLHGLLNSKEEAGESKMEREKEND